MKRAPGPERPWQCRHANGDGTVDETARRASHEELAVARVLAAEGHHVVTVAELRSTRVPDLLACGTSVEVKSFQSLEQRGGRPPTAERVANKILDARGQGAVAVIWAAKSGLAEATARSGYDLFCQRALAEGLGRLRSVRVMGQGFDISLQPVADLVLARQAHRAKPGPVRSPPPSRMAL